MQFVDLTKQYQKLKKEIDDKIQTVLNHAKFISGPEVGELEEKLADYTGVKHCITCGNGTDALQLALMAYGIKAGDAVFVPTFTFYATAETVSMCGATPVFVDVDRNTFNIAPDDLEHAIEWAVDNKMNPRAVIPVDLFGLPYDYKSITDLAVKHNLLVIEDGAQGFGGSIDGKKACSLGDISTTSFFPTKPLGCFGDGGAVFTNEDKISDYIKSLRVHGKGTDKYDNIRTGMNSRLDAIQAAVLLVKLEAFRSYELASRNQIAGWYNEQLRNSVRIPILPENCISSFAQYSILLESEEKRDRAQSALRGHGIDSMVYYKKSLHQQTVYRNNPSIYRGFPNAETISKTVISLPMHPYLTKEETMRCTEIIRNVLNV